MGGRGMLSPDEARRNVLYNKQIQRTQLCESHDVICLNSQRSYVMGSQLFHFRNQTDQIARVDGHVKATSSAHLCQSEFARLTEEKT